jgi:hypothetical protein
MHKSQIKGAEHSEHLDRHSFNLFKYNLKQ